MSLPFKIKDIITVERDDYEVVSIEGKTAELKNKISGKVRRCKFFPELDYPHNAKYEWLD
jgi:hypothetical protein